ncbi:hypothetical protein C6499_01205 [Candidatus Poribacteria bacterium]|nr:MAG: hypothetical protein C6499_01205 [Candidatus Poribacteria bacterium]
MSKLRWTQQFQSLPPLIPSNIRLLIYNCLTLKSLPIRSPIMSNQEQNLVYLVYFLAKSNFKDTNPDFIKIGYTSTELSRRLISIQTGNEAEIWEIGVLPFDTEDEARREENRIHKHFGGSRARGEWFYATPRLIQYIEEYTVQYTELFIEDVPPTLDEEVIEPDVQSTREEEVIAFGKWLRECRKKRNMTQTKVAEAVGYSRGAIALIEQDRGIPGQNLREALTALFGDFSDSTTETIPDNPISVTLGGTWISENTGIDTFIKVIKKIGIEKVKELNLPVNGIPLIADCDYPDKAQRKVETEEGTTYWIVSGTDTERKKKILDDIADRLERDMTVYVNLKS